jgi:hypothetical protein
MPPAPCSRYGDGIVGRFFDPVSGTWQPQGAIGHNTFGTGHSFGPMPLLDGNGKALVAYHNARISAAILATAVTAALQLQSTRVLRVARTRRRARSVTRKNESERRIRP